MASTFDPYHRWLGIPLADQPPHHYRLLGLNLFEADPEVIRDAVERQMAHVRTYQLGPHADLSQRILNELGVAKACLLDPQKKSDYDEILLGKLMQSGKSSATDHHSASTLTTAARTVILGLTKRRDLLITIAVGSLAVAALLTMMLKSGSLSRRNEPESAPTSLEHAARSMPSNGQESTLPRPALPREPAPPKESDKPAVGDQTPLTEVEQPVPAPQTKVASGGGEMTARDLADIVDEIEAALVVIETDQGLGSGFVVDATGVVVTNFHVVEGAASATARFKDGRVFSVAGWLVEERSRDLVVLRLRDTGKIPALGLSSALPHKLEPVVAFGSPKGFDFSVSRGEISAIRSGSEISDIFRKAVGTDIFGLHGYRPDSRWASLPRQYRRETAGALW